MDIEGRIKLIDFAVSIMNVSPNELVCYPFYARNSMHMAPEARAKELCNCKIDWFSLGNTISQICLLSDIKPDPVDNDPRRANDLLHCLDFDFFLLVLDLLRYDRKQRISGAKLFQDQRFWKLHCNLAINCGSRSNFNHPLTQCIRNNRFPALDELRSGLVEMCNIRE